MATGPSPKRPSKRSSKRYLRWFLAVAVVFALIYSLPQDVSHRLQEQAPFLAAVTTSTPLARQISAELLLSRPLARKDWTSIPKIIHQTWFPAGTNMSERAQRWVGTMRAHNPDWEYVLWDDQTNRLLVETHFPWFLEAYDALPKEILRADVIRNLYMFVFGGMYADVDTEALRPTDALFASHATSLASHLSTLTDAESPSEPMQRAFLGRMSHSEDLQSAAAVPNGWMASPPGHPFWLLPVLHILEQPEGTGDGSVEGLTGPGALSAVIARYYEKFPNGTARAHACETIQRWKPGWSLFCEGEGIASLQDRLVLLPQKQVYPFSWVDDKDSVCLAAWENPSFDPEECKRIMDVDAWPSYFITYCTHSW